MGRREPPPVRAGAGMGIDESTAARAAWLSSANVVGDHGDGLAAVHAESAGADGRFEAELEEIGRAHV